MHRLRRIRSLRPGLRLLALAGSISAAALLAGCTVPIVGGNKEQRPAAAPQGSGKGSETEATKKLGFPAFATNNTTRVGGQDPAADAAGVALAAFPSVTDTQRPTAVSLVSSSDWGGGIAAAVLAGPPVSAPILLGDSGGVPGATQQALGALAPKGGTVTDSAQVFQIGNVQVPAQINTTEVPAGDPATEAAVIAKLRDRLFGGPPAHVVIASADQPAFAMPAAAWAARSGDPVLFAHRDSVPAATMTALHGYRQLPVYLLGPSSVLSAKVEHQINAVTRDVRRVGAPSPVENAIAFARYTNGDFGWNLNDPGHGFVLANAGRPMDAAAAAALSSSGTWGALLLTDQPDTIVAPLRGYLLDVKPGYKGDPTRAVYNHVWVIGDESAVSVAAQAEVDELAEVAKVGLSAQPAPSKSKPKGAP